MVEEDSATRRERLACPFRSPAPLRRDLAADLPWPNPGFGLLSAPISLDDQTLPSAGNRGAWMPKVLVNGPQVRYLLRSPLSSSLNNLAQCRDCGMAGFGSER